jgi:hypothetical protein
MARTTPAQRQRDQAGNPPRSDRHRELAVHSPVNPPGNAIGTNTAVSVSTMATIGLVTAHG